MNPSGISENSYVNYVDTLRRVNYYEFPLKQNQSR